MSMAFDYLCHQFFVLVYPTAWHWKFPNITLWLVERAGNWAYRDEQHGITMELEPLSETYIQTVPDKCDRIIWRGHYYHLVERQRPSLAVCDYCGNDYGHVACCQSRYEYLKHHGIDVLPPSRGESNG